MILNTCLPKIKTRKEKAYWIFLILLQEDGFTKIAKIFGRAQDKSCKFTIKYTDRDFLYGSKGSYTAHTIDWAPRAYTFQQPVLPEPEIEADETENRSEESATNSDAITTSEETLKLKLQITLPSSLREFFPLLEVLLLWNRCCFSAACMKAHIYSFLWYYDC